MRKAFSWLFWSVTWPVIRPAVLYVFHSALLMKVHDWQSVRWLGHPIRQSILDLWTLQETIAELRPALIIETGTHEGGSALFYAQLFDLLGIPGGVITIDVAAERVPDHPRVEAWAGDSTSPIILERVKAAASRAQGPVLVILDSDHSTAHVARELEAYAPFVSPGSWMLVQDGVIDQVGLYAPQRPGPLPAISAFLKRHPEFRIDRERCDRFLVTHHPDGWLKRLTVSAGA
ncbi:MAG: CmcI family methyltransferase [Vicinamibacterales bacterium]|nr:CmcI family methyltransferase [Vicinamibacterales bacterium]